MKFKLSLLTLALCLSVGCLRSYNASPLSAANVTTTTTHESGLELRSKAYLNPTEITDKFGAKLAEDRQVIPVQVLLINKGTNTYRVLRSNFVVEETSNRTKFDPLSGDQMYELGRHGYGAPVCGMIFFGILGLPSLITTMNANEKLRDDYSRKTFVDSLVEPGKEATGSLMFDPSVQHLTRQGKYKLLVEVENTSTKAQITREQALN